MVLRCVLCLVFGGSVMLVLPNIRTSVRDGDYVVACCILPGILDLRVYYLFKVRVGKIRVRPDRG